MITRGVLRSASIALGMAALACAAGIVWVSVITASSSVAVPTSPGSSVQLDLEARLQRSYEIAIRYQRTMSTEQLKSLLGNSRFVNIRVLEDHIPIEVNGLLQMHQTGENINIAYAQKWVGQILGTFRGKRGAHYRVICTTVHPFGILAGAKPTLVVSVDPSTITAGAASTGLLTFALIFFASTSITCAALYRWRALA